MKNLILTILIAFAGITISGQTVSGVELADIDAEFIQIYGINSSISNKINIRIDFGQETNILQNKDNRIKNNDGSTLKFNSMIDALNSMKKYGYRYKDSYATADDGSVQYFILQKME